MEQFDVTKLKPRFHLKALQAMIEQEMFEDSSKATIIKDNLSRRALTTAESNKKKNERIQKNEKKKKKQKTLFAVGVSHC